ncbi:MAG: hypothetical protein QHH10_10475 [Peptococcaceae bacterium]|nr:hypothetical protein [Peptococcaceae bacterium]MDH7525722.1 hypothetical protein [Peptococcaceae bacterium]
MVEYACPSCGKKSRLPDFCCGQSMVQKGKYYCDSCQSQSSKEGACCGSPMRMI